MSASPLASNTRNIFEIIFAESLDIIIMVDGKNGQIVQANPTIQHALGYTPTELHGKHFSVLLAPRETEPENHILDQFRIHGTVVEAQLCIHADGTVIPMDMTVTMISYSQGSMILVTLRNAAERREMEQSLEQSHIKLEAKVQQRTAALLHANQQLQHEIAERKRVEDDLRRAHADLEQRVQARTAELKQANEALRKERASLTRRVAERTADLSLANTELARAVRAKDEFLATMSHELRTPLNAILGLAEALQEEIYGPLTERQVKSLITIERSGHHLLSLINDILDMSKIEAGHLKLQVEAVTIDSLCRSSLQFIRQQARKKQISVTFEIDSALAMEYTGEHQVVYSPDKVPATILADERRMKQILINLLTNAVKFTPDNGKVGLQVKANIEKHTVDFTVWDTGIGIAPEDQQRLFKPFVQIDSSLSRQYEGTGLGLALVMRLTELHGGSISVTSEPGVGSQFTVSLPVQHEQESHEEKPLTAECSLLYPSPDLSSYPLAPLSIPGPRILLAEDNESNVITITDYLTAKGYETMVARNGIEAIELVREYPPVLILMDMQMPRMDGLDAIRHIRSNPNLARIPIIAITALTMTGDRERCLESGANEYLSKPVRLKHLCSLIEHYVSHTQAT
jgi:PAS domain S-box-containing protein